MCVCVYVFMYACAGFKLGHDIAMGLVVSSCVLNLFITHFDTPVREDSQINWEEDMFIVVVITQMLLITLYELLLTSCRHSLWSTDFPKFHGVSRVEYEYIYHSEHGISQWEATLQCAVVSHWLNPYPEWQLKYDFRERQHWTGIMNVKEIRARILFSFKVFTIWIHHKTWLLERKCHHLIKFLSLAEIEVFIFGSQVAKMSSRW